MTALADALYAELHAAMEAAADPVRAKGVHAYFKEPVQTFGVAIPAMRAIVRPFANRLKREGTLDDAFALSELLLAGGNLEEGSGAETVMHPFLRQLTPAHFDRFDRWVEWFNNWAVTDSVSCHVTGELVAAHPELAARLALWTTAAGRWRKRAACVTLVMPVRRKAVTPAAVFAVTTPLMADRDDMVQKGAGWVLRDLSVLYPAEVVEYLRGFPQAGRILVRYVLEKASPEVRAEFVKRR